MPTGIPKLLFFTIKSISNFFYSQTSRHRLFASADSTAHVSLRNRLRRFDSNLSAIFISYGCSYNRMRPTNLYFFDFFKIAYNYFAFRQITIGSKIQVAKDDLFADLFGCELLESTMDRRRSVVGTMQLPKWGIPNFGN